MLRASAISALTLIASVISVYSTKGLVRIISYQHLLETGDQATRGAIMAFLLCVLFPECYNHLGLVTSLVGVGTSLATLHGFDLLYQNICNKSLLKSSPWYLYGMLLPHCCMEGFAISPYLNDDSFNLSLLGFFLLHKISELAMIALSTEAHNMTNREKNSLLTAFIVTTPLCMMTGVFTQSYLDHYPIIHDTALLISTAIFLHLALFCQFCSCEHKKNKSTLQIKPIFLISCIVVAGVLSIASSGDPSHHHHHHGHGHQHTH